MAIATGLTGVCGKGSVHVFSFFRGVLVITASFLAPVRRRGLTPDAGSAGLAKMAESFEGVASLLAYLGLCPVCGTSSSSIYGIPFDGGGFTLEEGIKETLDDDGGGWYMSTSAPA